MAQAAPGSQQGIRLLSRGELAASGVVDAEEAGGRIDDQGLVAVVYQQGGRVFQQLHLVFRSVRADISDVIEHGVRFKAVAFSDGREPFWSERAFGVNDKYFSVRSALLGGQLCSDRQRVRQLAFAGAEFAEYFRNAAGLDASAE